MDLTFDTTDTGEDVRITTNKMAQLLKAGARGPEQEGAAGGEVQLGRLFLHRHGRAVQETIDFFAAGGLPLRSSINLTLSSQDVTFEGGTSSDKASVDGELSPEPVVLPDDEGPSAGRRCGQQGRRSTCRAWHCRAQRLGQPAFRCRRRARGGRFGERRFFSAGASVEPGSRPASALRQGGFSASARPRPVAAPICCRRRPSRRVVGRRRRGHRWRCGDRYRRRSRPRRQSGPQPGHRRRCSAGASVGASVGVKERCRDVGQCRILRPAGREHGQFAAACGRQPLGFGEHLERRQGRPGRAAHRRWRQRAQRPMWPARPISSSAHDSYEGDRQCRS